MSDVDVYTPLTTLGGARVADQDKLSLQDAAGEALQWAVGELYLTVTALTVIGGVDTPIKALGTTAPSTKITPVGFTITGNNRLTFVGTEPKIIRVTASLSVMAAASNKNLNAYLALNDVVLSESKMLRRMSPAGDAGYVQAVASLLMTSGDYVELWIENVTDATDVTVMNLNLHASQVSIPI